jgi:hypothetical protein
MVEVTNESASRPQLDIDVRILWQDPKTKDYFDVDLIFVSPGEHMRLIAEATSDIWSYPDDPTISYEWYRDTDVIGVPTWSKRIIEFDVYKPTVLYCKARYQGPIGDPALDKVEIITQKAKATDEAKLSPGEVKINKARFTGGMDQFKIYYLPKNITNHMKLKIFDLRGRLIHQINLKSTDSIAIEAMWDGHDDSGNLMTPGTYVWQIEGGDNYQSGVTVLTR